MENENKTANIIETSKTIIDLFKEMTSTNKTAEHYAERLAIEIEKHAIRSVNDYKANFTTPSEVVADSKILNDFFKPFEQYTDAEKIRYYQVENEMLKRSLSEKDKHNQPKQAVVSDEQINDFINSIFTEDRDKRICGRGIEWALKNLSPTGTNDSVDPIKFAHHLITDWRLNPHSDGWKWRTPSQVEKAKYIDEGISTEQVLELFKSKND